MQNDAEDSVSIRIITNSSSVMASILLSHSYFMRFDDKAWGQMKPYPPLATLYAASVLRDAGHEVHFFDTMLASSEDEIIPHIERVKPDIVMFYEDSFNFLSKMCLTRMREACLTMSAYAKDRGCNVIAQGSDPVDHLGEYFAGSVDVVICGEGEHTAVELVDALSSNPEPSASGLREIKGIAYKDSTTTQLSPARPVIRDLDSLPSPAWDLIDMDLYRETWMKRHGYFSLNLVTTRGCPFHCNWCAKPVYGQVYNSHSPERIASEAAHLKSSYAPDHIWFADDILGLKPDWLKRYSEEITRLDAVLPFNCQTRADLLLKDNNIAHMASAGAQSVWIGAESGSQLVLDAMDKGTTVEQILDATRKMQDHGIEVAWFLQFGYLGETEEDIEKTIAMFREGKPDDIGISVSYPLPGTPFYEKVKSMLIDKQNWVDSGDLDLMYPGTFVPAYYRALHRWVHRTFRMRQGLSFLANFSTKRSELRMIVLIPYNALRAVLARIEMGRLKHASPQKQTATGQPA